MRDGGEAWAGACPFLAARVLVVEREAVVAADLELMLGELGCVVLGPLASAAAALAAARQAPPDAVLLGLGHGLCRRGVASAGRAARAFAGLGVPVLLVADGAAAVPAPGRPRCATSPSLLRVPFGARELRRALGPVLAGEES